MVEINLSALTKGGEVRNLSGHDRGAHARRMFELDVLDGLSDRIHVVVPQDIYTITPSFFQGLFAISVQKFGDRDKFLEHYGFIAEASILRQIENGIASSLMRRTSFMR